MTRFKTRLLLLIFAINIGLALLTGILYYNWYSTEKEKVQQELISFFNIQLDEVNYVSIDTGIADGKEITDTKKTKEIAEQAINIFITHCKPLERDKQYAHTPSNTLNIKTNTNKNIGMSIYEKRIGATKIFNNVNGLRESIYFDLDFVGQSKLHQLMRDMQ